MHNVDNDTLYFLFLPRIDFLNMKMSCTVKKECDTSAKSIDFCTVCTG